MKWFQLEVPFNVSVTNHCINMGNILQMSHMLLNQSSKTLSETKKRRYEYQSSYDLNALVSYNEQGSLVPTGQMLLHTVKFPNSPVWSMPVLLSTGSRPSLSETFIFPFRKLRSLPLVCSSLPYSCEPSHQCVTSFWKVAGVSFCCGKYNMREEMSYIEPKSISFRI